MDRLVTVAAESTACMNISDLGKTLSSRIVKTTLSKQKTYCNVFLSRKKKEKRGRGTDPVIYRGLYAVLSKLSL